MVLNFGEGLFRDESKQSLQDTQNIGEQIYSFGGSEWQVMSDSILFTRFVDSINNDTTSSDDDFFCVIHLPNNATIIEAICYSDVNASPPPAPTWRLERGPNVGGASQDVISTTAIDTVSGPTTASRAVIDNQQWLYIMHFEDKDDAGAIHGGWIKYTL